MTDDDALDPPGLTIEALNTLLKDSYRTGHQTGYAAGYVDGHRIGKDTGQRRAEIHIRDRVQQVIRGNLNHVARRLVQKPGGRVTIARLTTAMGREAMEVRGAVQALDRIGADDPLQQPPSSRLPF